jgi:predicted glycogen debranching enzyme
VPGGSATAPPTAAASSAGLDWGREVCGALALAEAREWLVTNGQGGFASGTVAGLLTRRYHGLLVAALTPPLGRTLLVAKLEETVQHGGAARALGTNRWADRSVAPEGYRELEAFRLDGTTPVWTYGWGEILLEKRVFMEPAADTTYVSYRLLRGDEPVTLELRALANYRDYHATTRAGDWRMDVAPVPSGVRVLAFAGARPYVIRAAGPPGTATEPAHTWYHGFHLAREEERGLDADDDHLHVATIRATLAPGAALTVVCSTDLDASAAGAPAWARRQAHEAGLRADFRAGAPAALREPGGVPGWIEQLVLAADQFVVRRPLPDDPEGLTVIAGYHWFGDWGRDTMIALPGLALATGRPRVARRILRTFARYVDRGMLPNRFPDGAEAPEYNTVDATLWYVEAIRAYHAATGDDALLAELFPVLADIVRWHRGGTRYGIAEDPADGLLRAGEPGVQLTWMDAKIGDWVVTPRTGKAVEINALWYNALRALDGFARRLGRPADAWERLADRVRAGFDRFWYDAGAYCHDVIDGPAGADPTLRPNQIFAVALPESPLAPERQRQVVRACADALLTSFGLRTLAPGHPGYRGRYVGGPRERDAIYHQGAAWGWLLGPFALAHFRVHGDAARARSFLDPMAHHLADYGVGSLGELFDGDAPFAPRGCIAQAWSVAETLRAWLLLSAAATAGPPGRPGVSNSA